MQINVNRYIEIQILNFYISSIAALISFYYAWMIEHFFQNKFEFEI
jgi:hypothetical protein